VENETFLSIEDSLPLHAIFVELLFLNIVLHTVLCDGSCVTRTVFIE
jgi:hypothetical protein